MNRPTLPTGPNFFGNDSGLPEHEVNKILNKVDESARRIMQREREKLEAKKQQTRSRALVKLPQGPAAAQRAVLWLRVLGRAGILPGADRCYAGILARITETDSGRFERAYQAIKPGDYQEMDFGPLNDVLESLDAELGKKAGTRKPKPRRAR